MTMSVASSPCIQYKSLNAAQNILGNSSHTSGQPQKELRQFIC
jgi:hypothetical protein